MADSHQIDIAEILSSLPQPQLSAPAPAPAPTPTPTPPPSTASASTSITAPVASTPNRVPEHLMHKNRLQEYAQRSYIPLPIYQSHNEGYQHAPKFRASVIVDGVKYVSPNTFSHRKAAEQDVAKIALECISKKIKDEGCPLINEDTIFCKSILNEFAVKMNIEMPAYSTRQSEALLPVFVSSLVFNGITYTGEAGRSKKEAEQLAARAVIRALLVTSGSATVLSEIIKSKVKLYAALNKVKESNYSTQNIASSYVPTAAISDSRTGMHLIAAIPEASAGMQPIDIISEATPGMHPTSLFTEASAGMRPTAAIPKASAGMQTIAVITEATPGMHPTALFTESSAGLRPTAAIPEASTGMHPTPAAPEPSTRSYMPHHEFKVPKTEPSSETVALPISFVPPVLGHPLGVGPSSANKRRKNKKKANKKLRTDVQPCVAAQPLTQVPPCSVAQ